MAAKHFPESHRPAYPSLYCISASRNTPRSSVAFVEENQVGSSFTTKEKRFVELMTLCMIQITAMIQSVSFHAMNETEEKEKPPDPSPFVDPSVVECPMARSLREQKLRHVARKCRAGDDQTKKRHAQLKTVGLPWLISV
jgi:hypothetical protein